MHQNEFIVLVLSSAVLVFIFLFRVPIRRLPAAGWLLASFFAVWVAWTATVLEHWFWPVGFNFIEHLGYASNGVLLFTWCWFGMKSDKVHAYD